MSLYAAAIKPLLFSIDPEKAHEIAISLGAVGRVSPVRALLRSAFFFEDRTLNTKAFGLNFKNPILLAAGLDKNCRSLELLSTFGFGGIELGTVTALAQPGNPHPRVFRLPNDLALINKMGIPNVGATRFVENLREARECSDLPIIGVNVGKSTATSEDRMIEDCKRSFELSLPLVDYVTLNVSCPNVADYSKLQQKKSLLTLFSALQEVNNLKKPVLVKISPDLSDQQMDDALECCFEAKIAGVIATNTTLSRPALKETTQFQGGLSGLPLQQRALECVSYIHRRTEGKLPIIGVGGIFTAADALKFIKAGASLVQIYSALVYEGPGLIKRIKQDLVKTMKRDGVSSISAYCGVSG